MLVDTNPYMAAPHWQITLHYHKLFVLRNQTNEHLFKKFFLFATHTSTCCSIKNSVITAFTKVTIRSQFWIYTSTIWTTNGSITDGLNWNTRKTETYTERDSFARSSYIDIAEHPYQNDNQIGSNRCYSNTSNWCYCSRKCMKHVCYSECTSFDFLDKEHSFENLIDRRSCLHNWLIAHNNHLKFAMGKGDLLSEWADAYQKLWRYKHRREHEQMMIKSSDYSK